ncbi:proprotein convertase subtilisin/kexin type 4 [Protopterus annectens]|uniref:proprotein convertase subtilisin/kexin type 4 n=1 Tax=Protopterus annectens TaxID=7888 RepID=UPI001CFBACB0|nr:proprotein convertase subtilisin/kexin type 4 [Protopterus annectens]
MLYLQIDWFEQQALKRRKKRQVFSFPTDPLFEKQWYMNGELSDTDLNVLTAWKLGYSGKGIVVSILDDGLEKDHPDLSANYNAICSYPFKNGDPDPQPAFDTWDSNRHGTRCAGEIAAVKGNGICGTGIAFNAKVGGVRMLDGPVTDLVEAKALSLRPQHIDIYSASWGPEDDGKSLDGPWTLAKAAFLRGVVYGRGGLGSIFVWASGNGGYHYDNCNCDGYTNSIYTLSVGSTTEKGEVPWYSEPCASTLTTTFSSGNQLDRKIVSTDLHYKCTKEHTGTSASAPLAAGMIALALEANPVLTWRDVQHIVVRVSKPQMLKADDWTKNGVGRTVSHHYGYGLLDAGHLVDVARKWTTVQPQRKCFIQMMSTPQQITSELIVRKNISACAGSSSFIRSLEHVQANISLSYTRRGDLEIYLTSPSGTKSVLVGVRPFDASSEGYNKWEFMSSHFWDEDPQGVWMLEIKNKGYSKNTGFLSDFILQLYGTDEDMMARHMEDIVIKECRKWSQDGQCEECQKPYCIFGHVCLSICPPHFYKSVKTSTISNNTQDVSEVWICNACHPSCYTCYGETANNCTTCPLFSTFEPSLHTCSAPAFSRFFYTEVTPGQFHNVITIVWIMVGTVITLIVVRLGIVHLLQALPHRPVMHDNIPAVATSEMTAIHMISEDDTVANGKETFHDLSTE